MLSDEFTHVDVQQLRTKWPTPCGCKPRCYYTQYSADTSRSQLNFTHYDTSTYFYRGLNLSNGEYSLMYVFPRNLIATRLRRDVYTSFTSLLGSFGSLLSFFLGFSVVSLLELFYFLLIKPCLHIYHDRYIIYQYLFK
ncbi:uncharacterized protein LOC128985400 [Macrosteles quadrilineatus]|nr:uncharacterized protein LOC128985400 [Macrosteles quadrilineatus]